MIRLVGTSLALMSILALVGCGDGKPTTHKVGGTVKLDGKPIEGARVTFIPDDQAVRPATATTDAQGKYALGTFSNGDGAMAGSYKITVTKFHTEAGQSPYDKPADPVINTNMSDEDQRKAYEQAYKNAPKGPGQGPKVPKTTNAVPAKYEQTATSGLIYTVAPGENPYDIDLTSK